MKVALNQIRVHEIKREMLNKKIVKALAASTFVVASTCGGAMAENLIRNRQVVLFSRHGDGWGF